MISVRLDKHWRVHLKARLDLPVLAEEAWEHLKDFETFACQDFFHSGVRLDGQTPASGLAFDLPHRFWGVGLLRDGRILNWTEGRGYSFSDLSRRGIDRGFPHVYRYSLRPLDYDCQLQIEVVGRWTARFLPRRLVHFWLGLVMLKIRICTEATLLWRIWRSRRATSTEPPQMGSRGGSAQSAPRKTRP